MKTRLILICTCMAMVGCTTTKPVATMHGSPSGTTKSSDSPQFLDNITANGPTASGRTSSEKEKQEFKTFRPPLDDFHPRFTIESGTTIQFKYAIVMDVEVERLDNQDLYRFIDSWWGTPYRMGGTTQKGVDCSAFVKTLESVIYGTNLPRTAREQKSGCSIITGSDLKEGDLVFFNTRGGVSHVGVYLTNNKFVHASTSGGVTISDLYDSYWHSRFLGAGRFKSGTAMK